eukprot:g31133.t1
MILPPSSVYGGVDGCNFLNALNFFQNTLVVMDYQPAWLGLYALAQNHDQPKGLVEATAQSDVAEAQEMNAASPFLRHEEPWSEANSQAINKLLEFTLRPAATGVVEGATPGGIAAWNLWVFKFLKACAEFLVTVCSYQRVFPKMNEPQEKERLVLLDKADGLLIEIWKDRMLDTGCFTLFHPTPFLGVFHRSTRRSPAMRMIGRRGRRQAATSGRRVERSRVRMEKRMRTLAQPEASQEPSFQALSRPLSEEEAELLAELRLLRAKIQEGKGDLAKAIQEVLYSMEFLRKNATTQSSQACNLGGREAQLRLTVGSKMWIRLRCAMVQLLVSQGRLKAAKAHIQQGLEETKGTQHDVGRVELLMLKVRVEVLSGRLLELQGHRHLGALAAAEVCLALARSLPMPTPSAVYARMMLVAVLQQNPSLAQLQRVEETPEALEATGGAEEEVIDASEMQLLEAAGSIIISPIAKELQKPGKAAEVTSFHEQQKMLAELVSQSLEDLERLLKILGLQMAPRNLNSYYDFGPDGTGQEAFKPPPDPPLLPELKASVARNDAAFAVEVRRGTLPSGAGGHCQLELAVEVRWW